MLTLPRKLLFAIEAVLDIAYHSSDRPVRSGEIAERQSIPRRYLEQVLQHLVRAEILAGVRGPRGGYRLARERRLISLGAIVRVVQGIDADAEPEHLTSDLGRHVVEPLWRDLNTEWMSKLDAITIDTLVREARTKGIGKDNDPPIDFTI